MACVEYHPDPYEGWRVIDGGNVTAYTLMTDTSGQWRCVLDLGCYRVYHNGFQ